MEQTHGFDSDNDLIGDGNENIIGTNPLDSDTDDDGVIDGLDDFPLIHQK